MGTIKKFLKFVFSIIGGVFRHDIGAYSAQAAFFVTISFIPFIMLLISILRFMPFTQQELLIQTVELFPAAAQAFVTSFVKEAYQKSDVAVVSITAVSALWAASIGIYAFMRGLNKVYCAEETRNYIFVRFSSVIYTLFLLALLVLCLGIFVFGNAIAETLERNIPQILEPALIVLSVQKIAGTLVLTLFFVIMFKLMPNRRGKLLFQIPGAAFSALGWVFVSFIFSYYYENLSSYSYLYGSLSVLVFFMLWIFLCIYILLLGAEINKYIEDKIENESLRLN